MNNNQIVYIKINRIKPHPNNPRKDLGDLTELANSIAAKGILQNLTVVPLVDRPDGQYSDDYTVIIGHCRLEAAKVAELTEVPCVIAEDLTRKEQIGMMLQENILRSDLSYYEQAESLQLMLDIGDTVETIAKESGFSKSTIYSRLKLLELDKERFQESEARGGTLEDYAKLDKIKSQEKRNEVLANIGTSNFNLKLRDAIAAEESKEKREAALIKLDVVAEEIALSQRYDYSFVKTVYEPKDIPEDANEQNYFYIKESYGIVLCRERASADSTVNAAEDEKRRRLAARNKELNEFSIQVHQLRYDFIKAYTKTNAKKHLAVIAEMLICALSAEGYGNFDTNCLLKMCDIECEIENDKLNEGALTELRKTAPERLMLLTAHILLEDCAEGRCHDYDGDYIENEVLYSLYGYLEQLGYEVSDDERDYMDGTHELFDRDEEDDENEE